MKRLGLTAALFAMGAFAESWTGMIADADCKHSDGTQKSIDCTKSCFKRGKGAVLVVGDKVIKIDDSSKEKIAAFAGQKVQVTGELKDDTVTVASVKAAE